MKFFFTIICYIVTIYSCFGQYPQSNFLDCDGINSLCSRNTILGIKGQKGFGIQEINASNGCIVEEHSSQWIKIKFIKDGTFGFEITPIYFDSSIGTQNLATYDYDFSVFGPNKSCDNLGEAIRCSTTNSKQTNLTNLLTGMNRSETDTSEGTDGNGNSFVKWIDVKAGETYIVLIDTKDEDSNFDKEHFVFELTGTAEILETPKINVPGGTTLNLKECDNDVVLDLKTTIDLTQNTAIVIGNQKDVTVTYYTIDAYFNPNPILNPSSFAITSNPQDILVSIKNDFNFCTSVDFFTVQVVDDSPLFGAIQSIICDDATDGSDKNGRAVFDLNKVTKDLFRNQNTTGLTFQYFLNFDDANANRNALSNLYYNSVAYSQTVYVTVNGLIKCSGIPRKIQLIVQPLPTIINYSLTQCEAGTNPDGLTLYNLKEADVTLTNSDTNLSVQYFLDATQEANNIPLNYNYTNISNPQQIIARITNRTTNCFSLGSLTLRTKVINEAPILLQECDILGQENGFAVFNLNDANLALSPNQTIKYYPSLDDALLEEKAITNFANYTNQTAYSESVFARVEEDNACYGIVEIQLQVIKLPNIPAQGTAFLCANIPNASVLLNANLITGNMADYSYKWFRNGQILSQTSYGIQANQTGNYSVEVTNGKNCSKTRTIAVGQSSTATTIDVNISDVNTDFNSVAVLVSGIGRYSYSLDEPNGPFQAANLFEKVSAGIHELYVYDENGCGVTSKTIAVIGIPKFFTPNADGFNDVWQIKDIDAIFNVGTTIFIFDRYGKLLQQIPVGDYSGWDGNLNGKPLPADDYWYNINLVDGRIVKGHFALKR